MTDHYYVHYTLLSTKVLHCTFKEREDVVDDRPLVTDTGGGDKVVPDRFEEHGHGLDHQQHRHHVVDLLHLKS